MQSPVTPLPASLLSDYPIPDIPNPMTWRQSLILNAQLMGIVAKANEDKAGIRKAEEERAKLSNGYGNSKIKTTK